MIGRVLRDGLVAGAAGTAALNAATYIDMAVRARPASEMPQAAIDRLATQMGTDILGEGAKRSNRLQGLGALTGIATGSGVGIVGAVLRPVLRRLPTGLAGLVLGSLAMAATDLPMTRMGLTDPAEWSEADWLSDALPHLAYGVVTAWTLTALSRHR